MNSISLRYNADAQCVTFLLDGRDLGASAGTEDSSLPCPWRAYTDVREFRTVIDDDVIEAGGTDVVLFACECGQVACSCVLVDVEVLRDTIRLTNFRYSGAPGWVSFESNCISGWRTLTIRSRTRLGCESAAEALQAPSYPPAADAGASRLHAVYSCALSGSPRPLPHTVKGDTMDLRHLSLILTPALVIAAAEDDRKFQLNAHWTDQAPVLDGEMDDACWSDAEVAGDFVMLNSDTPANEQTEVRVCYDAENLYAFYLLHESQVDRIKYGQPEDMRDAQTSVFNDLGELFLDPGRTKKFKYQFMASPLAARFDMCSGRGRAWNPEWRAKAAVHKQDWCLEISVPFRELALSLPEPEYDTRFRGTPMPGDVWGVNLCRDQGRLREWSYWKRIGQSFHKVDRFPTLRFCGRKRGGQAPSVKWRDRTSLYYGPGSIGVTADGKAEVEFVLRRDGKEVERTTKTGPGTIEFPYHILEAGEWTADVTARADGQTIYAGRSIAQLKPLGEMLAGLRQSADAAYERLRGLEHPAANELEARLDKVMAAAAGPLAKVKDPKALSREAWQSIEAQLPAVRALWRDAEYDVHIVRFYPKGQADVPLVVASATPDVRIHRRELLDTLDRGPIRLALAGRERESFQILVIPFWRDVDNATLSFSDLRGEAGTIAAGNYTWSVVDYVEMENYDPETPGSWQFEPDILWPGKPTTAEAGRIQPLFVDLYLPENTPAGEYTGTVTVCGSGASRSLPIRVRSYGFNIPRRNTLEQDPWYAPSAFWAAYFGKHHGSLPFTVEMYERHLKVLSRYRMAAFPLDYFGMWPHLRAYREADGSFTWDFSTWKRIVELGHKYGAHGMGSSMGCNAGAFRPFLWGHIKVIDRATGEEGKMADYTDMRELKQKMRAGEVYWDEHPFYCDFMKQYVEFLRRNGLIEMQDFEMHDEPKSIPHMKRLVRHHQLLRRIAPEINFKNYGFGPDFHPGNIWAVGWADTWAPNLSRMDAETIEAIHQRRARWGEKFWFYTCGEARPPDGRRGMFIVYDNSYLAPRMHSWVAWRVRADGFLIFMLNGVPESNDPRKAKGRKVFPEVPWKSGKWQRGCGTLVYPTPERDMLPGMRLTNYRDGLEDFEYFHRLHDRMRYLVPHAFPKHKELWDRAEKALDIPKDILGESLLLDWTQDMAHLNAKRDELAGLIREIEHLVGIGAP